MSTQSTTSSTRNGVELDELVDVVSAEAPGEQDDPRSPRSDVYWEDQHQAVEGEAMPGDSSEQRSLLSRSSPSDEQPEAEGVAGLESGFPPDVKNEVLNSPEIVQLSQQQLGVLEKVPDSGLCAVCGQLLQPRSLPQPEASPSGQEVVLSANKSDVDPQQKGEAQLPQEQGEARKKKKKKTNRERNKQKSEDRSLGPSQAGEGEAVPTGGSLSTGEGPAPTADGASGFPSPSPRPEEHANDGLDDHSLASAEVHVLDDRPPSPRPEQAAAGGGRPELPQPGELPLRGGNAGTPAVVEARTGKTGNRTKAVFSGKASRRGRGKQPGALGDDQPSAAGRATPSPRQVDMDDSFLKSEHTENSVASTPITAGGCCAPFADVTVSTTRCYAPPFVEDAVVPEGRVRFVEQDVVPGVSEQDETGLDETKKSKWSGRTRRKRRYDLEAREKKERENLRPAPSQPQRRSPVVHPRTSRSSTRELSPKPARPQLPPRPDCWANGPPQFENGPPKERMNVSSPSAPPTTTLKASSGNFAQAGVSDWPTPKAVPAPAPPKKSSKTKTNKMPPPSRPPALEDKKPWFLDPICADGDGCSGDSTSFGESSLGSSSCPSTSTGGELSCPSLETPPSTASTSCPSTSTGGSSCGQSYGMPPGGPPPPPPKSRGSDFSPQERSPSRRSPPPSSPPPKCPPPMRSPPPTCKTPAQTSPSLKLRKGMEEVPTACRNDTSTLLQEASSAEADHDGVVPSSHPRISTTASSTSGEGDPWARYQALQKDPWACYRGLLDLPTMTHSMSRPPPGLEEFGPKYELENMLRQRRLAVLDLESTAKRCRSSARIVRPRTVLEPLSEVKPDPWFELESDPWLTKSSSKNAAGGRGDPPAPTGVSTSGPLAEKAPCKENVLLPNLSRISATASASDGVQDDGGEKQRIGIDSLPAKDPPQRDDSRRLQDILKYLRPIMTHHGPSTSDYLGVDPPHTTVPFSSFQYGNAFKQYLRTYDERLRLHEQHFHSHVVQWESWLHQSQWQPWHWQQWQQWQQWQWRQSQSFRFLYAFGQQRQAMAAEMRELSHLERSAARTSQFSSLLRRCWEGVFAAQKFIANNQDSTSSSTRSDSKIYQVGYFLAAGPYFTYSSIRSAKSKACQQSSVQGLVLYLHVLLCV